MMNPFMKKMKRLAYVLVVLLPVLLSAACAGNPQAQLPPAGSAEPDKFLFDRGTQELAKKHWFAAREYFRNIVDRYPQSAYRPDAKLALGDTYLAENSAEAEKAKAAAEKAAADK